MPTTDDFIEPPANTGSGNKNDCEQATTASGAVKRQRVVVRNQTTPYHLVVGASDNAVNVKASKALVFHVCVSNVLAGAAAYAVYLKLYSKASAPNNTDTPQRTIPVQPGVTVPIPFPGGTAFAAGLGIRVTKGAADGDNTPVAAGDAIVDIDYD